ncbi:unnamed protein product, partial [Rotaria sordida]
LCATSCGAFNTASKAFLKLEDDPSISEEDRKEYQKLAFQIFLSYMTSHLPTNILHNETILWKKSQYNHVFNCNSYKNNQEEYFIPIIETSSSKIDKLYCFDKYKRSSKNEIIIQESSIKDYLKSSLYACLSCFWMCTAQKLSNCLYTNLVLTYVIGGIIIGVLIMTVLVTFIVGIKGYFSKSL